MTTKKQPLARLFFSGGGLRVRTWRRQVYLRQADMTTTMLTRHWSQPRAGVQQNGVLRKTKSFKSLSNKKTAKGCNFFGGGLGIRSASLARPPIAMGLLSRRGGQTQTRLPLLFRPFESLLSVNKKTTGCTVVFLWRRLRDSNPRRLLTSTVFKTAAFDRSAKPPLSKHLYYTQKSRFCQ